MFYLFISFINAQKFYGINFQQGTIRWLEYYLPIGREVWASLTIPTIYALLVEYEIERLSSRD